MRTPPVAGELLVAYKIADGQDDLPAGWTVVAGEPGAAVVELEGLRATLDAVIGERDRLRLVVVNSIENIAHGRIGHAIAALRAAKSLFE